MTILPSGQETSAWFPCEVADAAYRVRIGGGGVTVVSGVLTVSVGGGGTTYSNFTTTVSGLVPAPGTATGTRYLRDDGTWVVVSGGTGSFSRPVTTISASGTSQAMAFAVGSGDRAYDVTLTGNCTFTLTGGTAGQEQIVRLWLRGGTGGFTPTWPAGVVWRGATPTGSIPAGAIMTFTFTTPDGGTTIAGDY